MQLVRLGIGHDADRIAGEIAWNDIHAIALQQGLSAVIVDGVEKLPAHQRPPKPLLLKWMGEVLLNYEYRYVLYCRAIAEIASFYNSHGYKMMVLKGYGCGLNWPKPDHRPYGDIDIWLYGKQKEADALLAKEKGVVVDASHHHHTVFDWHGFAVENHYDFVNVYDYKSSKELEVVFKTLGAESSKVMNLFGEDVYFPSSNLHALFLIRHMVSHFASTRISLRQVLDWAFFVKKNTQEIDWKWLMDLLDEYHMIDFVNCINAICIEDLGFSLSIFPTLRFRPSLKDRVLSDILSMKKVGTEPKCLLGRIVFKTVRWKSNWWKQDLCYNENRWSGFWRGVWYHLLKPQSI